MPKNSLIILAVIIAVTIIVSIFLFAMLGSTRFTETTGPVYLSPTQALPLAEQLNSTSLLLHEPIGGFRGPLRWISEPANVTWDYRFYSRNYGPGNVTLSVYEVRNPLNTTPVQPTPGISARMIPDRFTTVPGSEVTSQLVVNITSEGYSHNSVTRTFYVHAKVEGEKNAVAYDWIRVRMGDRPISYTSYQTKGDISNSNITIHRGDRWVGNITVSPGERGTGPVMVWFKELDCETLFSSSIDTPQPPNPNWPEDTVYPDQFIGRSFGNYQLPATISAGAPSVQTGTYCYGITIDTADSRTSFDAKVHVID